MYNSSTSVGNYDRRTTRGCKEAKAIFKALCLEGDGLEQMLNSKKQGATESTEYAEL